MVRTRKEFIDYFAGNCGLGPDDRHDWGISASGQERVAVPCACGEDGCQGWQMRSPESLIDDLKFYGEVR